MRQAHELFILHAREERDPDRLLSYFVTVLQGFGFDRFCYRHASWGFKTEGVEKRCLTSSLESGFAADCRWTGAFVAEARLRGAPVRMGDLLNSIERQNPAFEGSQKLHAAGLHHGAVIPVFSRPGDFAYFIIASSTSDASIADSELLELQALCHAFHVRHHSLTARLSPINLSRRETEVMELIAKGKSNSAIARTLKLSENTIDTLVRRCFAKLGATSRVEAALTAMSRGLILP